MEHGIIVREQLRRHGVLIYSVQEGFDPATSAGKAMADMLGIFNQQFLENLSVNTQLGVREAIREGYWAGGRPPYGYKFLDVHDGKRMRHKLQLDDEEKVATVQRIFDLYLKGGQGLKAIASILNKEEVPCPTGGTWKASAIRSILDNPVYTGALVWGKQNSDYQIRHGADAWNEREKWLINPNQHPAIIGQATFDAVEKEAERRWNPSVQSKMPTPARRKAYVLSTKLWCGCGEKYEGRKEDRPRADGSKRTTRRYLCKGNQVGTCHVPYLPSNKIDSAPITALGAWAAQEDDPGLSTIVAGELSQFEARLYQWTADKETLEADVRGLDGQVAGLLHVIGERARKQQDAGTLTDRLDETESLLQMKRIDLEKHLQSQPIGLTETAVRESFVDWRQTLQLWFDHQGIDPQAPAWRRAIQSLVERVEVGVGQKEAIVTFRFPVVREPEIQEWLANWRDTSVEHWERLPDIPTIQVAMTVDLRSEEERNASRFVLRRTRSDARQRQSVASV